jgi:hypothetical protein
MDAMRRPDARLIQTFSYYGKPDYWIAPSGGRVEQKIAEQIITHPQVIGGKDALFPGHHQTWRMRPGALDAEAASLKTKPKKFRAQVAGQKEQ